MGFIQRNAWAPNTIKSLTSQWKAFTEFCGLANITMLPIPDHIICFFATWLVSTGRVKTAGSLAQYVSAVRTVHKMLKLPQVPTPSQYGPLDMILKGFRRIAQHKTKKSLPISPPILSNFLQSEIPLHSGPLAQQTIQIYRHLCLIYFLTMLRSSNLIAKSSKSIDLKMILCWEDVKPLRNNINNGIVISVPKAKNNQFGERVHQIPLAAASNPLLCPVKAILGLVAIYGKNRCFGNRPIFQVPDGNGNFKVILRHKFDAWFKMRLGNMKLDASLYTLHGFRHAGIQEHLLAEGNLALCKISSDHSSDAILEYSFIPEDRRLSISSKVNRSLAAAVAAGSPRSSRPLDSHCHLNYH